MREVNMLQKRDKDNGKIDFVDISSPDYEPTNNANISYEQVRGWSDRGNTTRTDSCFAVML